MQRKILVDNIEADFARCETDDGEVMEIPIAELPYGLKPQDWLTFEDGVYRINHELTIEKKMSNIERYKKLKNNTKSE